MIAPKKVCCICNKHYTGYGNNAEPIKTGLGCDRCNQLVVAIRLELSVKDIKVIR